jgi:ATP-dependent DNA helicase RecG
MEGSTPVVSFFMVIIANTINQPVSTVKGVGPKRAELLLKLGIATVEDLLLHLPLRYEDRATLCPIAELTLDTVQTVSAKVLSAAIRFTGKGGRKRIFEVAFGDDTGVLRATWFKFPSKTFSTRFPVGSQWLVSGKVSMNKFRGSREMTHPITEPVMAGGVHSLAVGRVTPVYPLTEGLTQHAVRTTVDTLMAVLPQLVDFVPEELNHRFKLPTLQAALKAVHWPEKDADLAALFAVETREQKKLIFNELFIFQVALALRRKMGAQPTPGVALTVDDRLVAKIESIFPFTLTDPQKEAIADIRSDVTSGHAMHRLLQGDVGSGKTAVALAACLMAIHGKRQAAIMAPTEILATQHAKNITALLAHTPVSVALLTSAATDKKETINKIADGSIHIVIGTHALIQEGIRFHNLGLVVIDEQHRFGVRQRAHLQTLGEGVHTLIMTATPIPRTLAMTLYGDLEVSALIGKPPGRHPVATALYPPVRREAGLQVIRSEIDKGHQGYVIYPLVEESEKLDLKAATQMYDHLSTVDFPDLKVGLTHGRMKPAEKEEVMGRFYGGEIDILVTTTVVEVGVDCPNATVIMIEHAERFGLSQLHQLRGRVGRSIHPSHCLLMADEQNKNSAAWRRLSAMTKSQDGFFLAEEDLAIRGAGDFFGVKQSGLPQFKIADIVRDAKILAAARNEAFRIVDQDPTLSSAAHEPLREAIRRHWKERFALADIG